MVMSSIMVSLVLFMLYDKPMINLICLLVVSLMVGVGMFCQVGVEIYSVLVLLVLVGGLFVTISFVILFSGHSVVPDKLWKWEAMIYLMLFVLSSGVDYFLWSWMGSLGECGELSPMVSGQFSKFCLMYLFLVTLLLLVLPLIDELLEEIGGGSFHKM